MKPWAWLRIKPGLTVAVFSLAALACAFFLLFHSRESSTVTGHVLGVDGRPIAGATVYIQSFRLRGVPDGLQTARSEAEGTFRFHVSDPYALTEVYARLRGRGIGLFRFDPSNSRSLASLLDVPVVLRLGPSRRLSTRVVDWNGRPVTGVNVGPDFIGVRSDIFEPSASVRRALGAVTDADGQAMLDSIPLAGRTAVAIDDDRFELVEAAAPTPSAEELKIGLRPACKVEGTVTLDGVPVRGLVLLWEGSGGVHDWVLTDSNGKFQIGRAPKGRLSFEDATSGNKEDDAILPDTETIAYPASTRHVKIHMLRGTVLRIKVVDPAGNPVGNVRINGGLANPPYGPGIMPTNKVLGLWGPIFTTGAGITHIRVLPEKYGVRFSRFSERRATTASVVVGKGPARDLLLTLPRDATRNRLRVQVVDAEGYPLRNGLWCEFRNPGYEVPETLVWPLRPDGTADLDTSRREMQVVGLRAQCADELSDLVIPPKEGLVVLKLRHVGFGAVQGVIRDERGQTIAGAEVQIDPKLSALAGHADDLYPWKVVTDRKGRFTFQGLYPRVQICLTVHAIGYLESDTSLFQVAAGETQKLPDVVLSR